MADTKYAPMLASEIGSMAFGNARLAGGSIAPDSLGTPLVDLSLALAMASADIRLLTKEQVKLREVLATQQSLFKAGGAAPAASEPKSKLTAEIEQRPAPKSMHPAMASETALVELNQVLGLSKERLQALAEENLQAASDKRIAPSGATNVDLAQVQLAGARAGIGEGNNANGRATELSGFAHDAGVTASAFQLGIKPVAEMLSGWRSSMKLDRYQSQDLADATTYLGHSGLDAKPADIGSVVLRSGEKATEAGMKPEQVAALAAALLSSGADKDGASATLKSLATVLGKGSAASPEQRAALTRLELDPALLADRMQKDAPGAINAVLAALNEQSVQERGALTKTLFGENDSRILELLKKPDDVKTAFSLVSDKHKYATSELGTDAGATAKTAEAFGNTSQGRWNALDASLTRLSTAVGNALAPVTDAIAVSLTMLVNGLSAAAEALPFLTAGLAIAGMAALPFVGGALKSGVASVLEAVSTRLLRLASTRMPSDISDMIVGDDDRGGGRRGKRSRGGRIPTRTQARATSPRPPAGGRLRSGAARLLPIYDEVKVGLKLLADSAKSTKLGSMLQGAATRLAPLGEGIGAKVMPLVENLGAKLAPKFAMALPALKLGAPIAIAHAAYTGLKGWKEGDDKAVKGAAGELAGAAIGATIGTLIAPGIGTWVGGAVGGYIGSSLGKSLGSEPADKLSPPAEVSKSLASVQTLPAQYTYAPSVHVSGSELVSSEKVGTMLSQVLESHFTSQFVPGVATNALATRRDAALTDGVA